MQLKIKRFLDGSIKFKGNTLIEAITSMTLILMVAAFAYSIILKVNDSSLQDKKIDAYLSSKNIIEKIKKERLFQNAEWDDGTFKIMSVVTTIDQNKYHLHLKFKDYNNLEIFSIKTVVSVNQ